MRDWTNINGSGNKKVEFDKPNKDYQFLYINRHSLPLCNPEDVVNMPL
jgi:hypothetical protein